MKYHFIIFRNKILKITLVNSGILNFAEANLRRMLIFQRFMDLLVCCWKNKYDVYNFFKMLKMCVMAGRGGGGGVPKKMLIHKK